MKYHIITHGCQMNEHDSERIAFLLEEMGYEPTAQRDDADFILMNTCLVRENAELKVYGQLGALKPWHDEREGRILAVSGCMMQTGPAQETIQKKYPQVDLVFGTQNIQKLPELIARHRATGERVFDTTPVEEDLAAQYRKADHQFAYVNIMTGCNNFCTYCIVPFARGRESSRRAIDVVREVERLAADGTKEIMLLGQNVNSYRDEDVDFPALLARVAEVPGVERVRFMSSHPKDLSDALIQVMASHPNVERHFHLPLQSGSNAVLKAMNRKYTREQYLDRVRALRAAMPEIALSTDIIVGFPGETEEDHRETLELCREVEFDAAFTFIYSPRPGTVAAKRVDQFVDAQTTARRFQELLDVLYPIFARKNHEAIGQEVRVLVEGISKNDPHRVSGRDAQNRLVHFPGDERLIGQMAPVKITEAGSFALVGEPLFETSTLSAKR
ncbi:MAG: tRNA (N6-isopentenyl adenosine(37)-C2)-methylthiotransferase MiaB [Peptoniphilaceae bacterium]|nr:tRNA (N6-isopentenyl adenosine(37)-C2)-methylthiotransferase MiaB [Peptoniphilaceae bacterium]MDY6086033.1 tRNA (N6-isopentenyl adenosine(37)-C2)-methylthiotransferase MiaB [Peptoniphilaceae bacterium]